MTSQLASITEVQSWMALGGRVTLKYTYRVYSPPADIYFASVLFYSTFSHAKQPSRLILETIRAGCRIQKYPLPRYTHAGVPDRCLPPIGAFRHPSSQSSTGVLPCGTSQDLWAIDRSFSCYAEFLSYDSAICTFEDHRRKDEL